ncbi:hypothetical protein B0T22DRAFT_523186 [Podospora appendiculata]|uniref:Uncharacterized protein n=1 Tax=Podospora appendiculata TaxID=314037 RepID=A0AAE0X062_9PEZI|nr:hypothetical protein B0T22DRAFT_523186 [Podospora appendiculata]
MNVFQLSSIDLTVLFNALKPCGKGLGCECLQYKEMRKILGPNVGTSVPGDPDDPGSNCDGDFANDSDYCPERTPPDDPCRGRSVSPDPPQQNLLANAYDQNAAQDNSQFYDHSRQAANLHARVAALGRDDFIQYIHATRPPARNNPGNPDTARDKEKDKDKDGDKDRYRGNRDYRDYRDRRRDDRPRDRAPFAGEPQDDEADDAQSEASADSYGYSDDSDAGHPFIILNRHLTCYKCHADFTTHSVTRAHIRDCTPFKAVQAESVRPRFPADPSVRTCGFCNKLFDSRNKLFKHLKLCEDAKKGFFRPSESKFGSSDESDSDESDKATATNAFNTDHVEERFARVADDFEVQIAPAQLLEEADSSPMSSYTHLRVQARASEKSANMEVCLDPGAGRSLVDSRFLKQLRHSVSPRRGRVKGVGDDILRLTEWATFDLFLVGKNAAGKNSLLKITKSA